PQYLRRTLHLDVFNACHVGPRSLSKHSRAFNPKNHPFTTMTTSTSYKTLLQHSTPLIPMTILKPIPEPMRHRKARARTSTQSRKTAQKTTTQPTTAQQHEPELQPRHSFTRTTAFTPTPPEAG
ncbi:hypothetical protein M758_6G129000, partial [Ceratodon purpureus]